MSEDENDAKAPDDHKEHEEPKKEEGEKGENKGEDDKKPEEDQKPKKPPIYKKPAFIITAIIVVLVLIVAGIIIWLIERQYVSTDDAYVDGHVVQVSPQIAAQVLNLYVIDNQFVRKGDLLVRLDPTNYLVAVDEAKATVAADEGKLLQAETQIDSAQAQVGESIAKVHGAQASVDVANKDLERYQKVDRRARSQQQLDNAVATKVNDDAQLEQAQADLKAAQANVDNAEAAAQAADGQLQSGRADQARAEVNLGYCNIYAPSDGRVTQRTVEMGNYVTAGQAMFMLVDPNVWVTANYKETQLTLLQPGQAVTIKVDAFPGVTYHGWVDSIQAGSGSRFSVLPAENATGNYVKIVQRVPVKIRFQHDVNTNDFPLLSPGLSVVPRTKVR